MTKLTDRYIWAVVRLLDEPQRADIDAELRSLIADMIDERLGSAEVPDVATITLEEAEREVLTSLGDPKRLASRYIAEPRSLIGPEMYPSYVRMLRLILMIGVPVLVALSLFSELLSDDITVSGAIAAIASGLFGGGIQIAFCVTLGYAIAERLGWSEEWSLDELPEAPTATGPTVTDTRRETSFGIVVTVLAAALLLWQHLWAPLRDSDGNRVPFLDPDIWNGAGQLMLVALGLSLVVQIVVVRRGRWTTPLAAANAVVNAASLAIVVVLAATDTMTNPDFFAEIARRSDWETVPSFNPWTAVVVIAIIEIWDSVEAFRASRLEQAGRR